MTPAEAAEARTRQNLGIDYVLRQMLIYTGLTGGDPARALIFIAALRACTQHLPDLHPVSGRGFIDDSLRRPASVSAIARSLGLPAETVRRHILALEAAGLLARTPEGGVLVTSAHLDSPAVEEAVRANVASLNRLVRGLESLSRANGQAAAEG